MEYTEKEIEEFIKESNAIELVYEQEAFDDSLKAWSYLTKRKKLTMSTVLRVHHIMMLRLYPRIAGKFRKCDVIIGGRYGYPVSVVKSAVESWVASANNVKTEEEILDSHVHYEFIHPFADGNGRSGRLFLLWQRQKAGLPCVPILNDTKYEDYYPIFNTDKAFRDYTYNDWRD